MDWIKQNLKLVLSIAVAVLVVGGGGYWAFSQMQRSNKASEDLASVSSRWASLERQSPHPGTDNVNNIAAAERDLEMVNEVFMSAKRDFATVSYPVVTNNFQFKTMLERTVAGLRKEAMHSGVRLQPGYAFTFRDQLDKVQFPVESMQQWSEQLQEIKTISELLFSQRVHSVERIRRVAINSEIDVSASEFINASIVTNDVAVLTPYEVVFKGYSGELASVLEGIANASQGFRVKAIKVEPTTIAGSTPASGGMTIEQYNRLRAASGPGLGEGAGPNDGARRLAEYRQRMADRYGAAPTDPAAAPVTQPIQRSNVPVQTGPKISEVVKEKPLQVTLLIDFIKPLPSDANSL